MTFFFYEKKPTYHSRDVLAKLKALKYSTSFFCEQRPKCNSKLLQSFYYKICILMASFFCEKSQLVSKFNLQKGDLIRIGQLLLLFFFQISLSIHFHLGLRLATEKNGQSKPYIKINEQSNQQKQQQ